jgi:long-chain acyl-CoA synthetase
MSKSWERSYPPGVTWDAALTIGSPLTEFEESTRKWAGVAALEFAGHTVDYRTLGFVVERLSVGLKKIGVGPGVHVGLLLANTPHFPIAFYAVLRAGGVVVNFSPLDAEREIAGKLKKAKVNVVIALSELAGKVSTTNSGVRLIVGGLGDLLALRTGAFGEIPDDPAAPIPMAALFNPALGPAEPMPNPAPGELAVLQFTGGTSGIPKAAELTHGNLSATVSIYDIWSRANGLEPGHEAAVAVLPLFHIFGLCVIMMMGIRNGYTLLLKLRWDTDDIIDTIAEKKPSLFFGVPTMFRALASDLRTATTDFSCFKFCASGGAPLPVELGEEFQRLTGKSIREGWGMTETCSAGTGMPGSRFKAGSAGVPLPGILIEIRDLNEGETVLPPGEAGEICIGGPNILGGYYEQPEENAQAFIDGLFRTGDIGYLDEDGYLFIVDRKKDMILSGGFNVYPRTVEEAIYGHPAVEEVVVIGIPDKYRGESAKAFVKLRAGHDGLTLDELKKFLADKIGKHEIPAALELRPELPKTPVGKLWKKPLVDEERAKSGAG